MWQEFPTWMIEGMRSIPLIVSDKDNVRCIQVNEPGASLRLVYADMLEDAGNEEDAYYFRQAIGDWYDCLNPIPSFRTYVVPTPLLANTDVAFICHTHIGNMYIVKGGQWVRERGAQWMRAWGVQGTRELLNDRSPEVRWSFTELQAALYKNLLFSISMRNLIIKVEHPDGKITPYRKAKYIVTDDGTILHYHPP
jgi:hypothetical protein